MTRYCPSRVYTVIASLGLLVAAYSAWVALHWWPAWIAFALAVAPTPGAVWMALRPTIEVNSTHLVIGQRAIAWTQIRRVDQTHWVSPMIVYLTLVEGLRLRLIYPGRAERGQRLLARIQQHSTLALINGVPHARIFGEPATPAQSARVVPRVRLVSENDEAEIERLFNELKSGDRPGGDERSDERGDDQ